MGFQSKKSPGTDGLKPIVFKHLPDDMIQFITSLYKALVLLEFTPTKWKECKMILIPKPGKPSYKIAKSWRPISLTNYLLKGLERLCAWQVDGEAPQNPVHTLQHGFRTDRNTDTALSSVVNNLEKGTYLDQDTITIFLDIAAAFDTICPGLIKRKLLEHGGDPLIVS